MPNQVIQEGLLKILVLILQKPEEETTYTITFSVANTTNNISKAKLVTSLPPRVSYKNLISPKMKKLTFDAVTRELVWDIGTIPRETGLSGAKKKFLFKFLTPFTF